MKERYLGSERDFNQPGNLQAHFVVSMLNYAHLIHTYNTYKNMLSLDGFGSNNNIITHHSFLEASDDDGDLIPS